MSVNFSSPGAPLRAPVFLLALFSTKNVPQKLEVVNIVNCFNKAKSETLLASSVGHSDGFGSFGVIDVSFGFFSQRSHAREAAVALLEDRGDT